MPTYISLLNWTDQGIKTVKESPKRLDAARKTLKEMGAELKTFYMTQGTYDAALILEAPNDEFLPKFSLKIGTVGIFGLTPLKPYQKTKTGKSTPQLPYKETA